MKKKLLVCALLAIFMSIAAYGTTAYFTYDDTSRNVITTAGVDITLQEWQVTPDGEKPYPTEEIAVMPNTEVSKVVTILNNKAQAYVRAQVQVVFFAQDGTQMQLTEDQIAQVVTLSLNTTDWQYQDGWYYYNTALNSNQATQPLMTAVSFDGVNMTNIFQGSTVKVNVFAQATQTAHNGDTALQAVWPDTAL